MADNGGSSAVRDLIVPDRKPCISRLQERELPEPDDCPFWVKEAHKHTVES
jgi:hypothetical protein